MTKAASFLIGLLIFALLLSCAGLGEKEMAKQVAGPAEKPKEPEEPEAGLTTEGELDVGDGEGSEALPLEAAPAAKEEKARAGSMAEDSTEWASSGSAPASPDTSAAGASAGKPRAEGAPSASGLKAGFADDNKQYNYFLQFLKEYGNQVEHLPINIEERIILRVQDNRSKSLPNASVVIFDEKNRPLCRGLTYADGSFLFFPSEYGSGSSYRAAVTYNQRIQEVRLERFGKREIQITYDFPRPELPSIPLDILFVMDTTGSMGEEIQRLKTTIEIINLNLSSLSSRPKVRFGMVLYKDRGDEYVTEVVPFTEDLERFQGTLNRVEASGGGDTPEDLQAALQEAMKMAWNRNGIRLAFIITDAPPHLDYGDPYSYVNAAQDARAGGIKVFSVGTGGLELMGEYILRQISQYSAAKFIFLTYGETGESEGGKPGSVSHHTGANYQTDKLEAIIIRFAKEELSHVTGQPLEGEEEYFQATKISDEQREETLAKLFTMAVSQLVDYSTFRIPLETPAAVLPLSPASQELNLPAEYFTEQLVLSFSRESSIRKTFRILERQDLQKVLSELELQLSGLAEEKDAARVGVLLGAKVLVIGKLYSKAGGYELFLKLLRVETGEILSVTKALLDRKLGLES